MQYLSLNYTLEAETYSGTKKFSRVWFDNGETRPHFVNRIVTLDKSNLTHCQRETVYLKVNAIVQLDNTINTLLYIKIVDQNFFSS